MYFTLITTSLVCAMNAAGKKPFAMCDECWEGPFSYVQWITPKQQHFCTCGECRGFFFLNVGWLLRGTSLNTRWVLSCTFLCTWWLLSCTCFYPWSMLELDVSAYVINAWVRRFCIRGECWIGRFFSSSFFVPPHPTPPPFFLSFFVVNAELDILYTWWMLELDVFVYICDECSSWTFLYIYVMNARVGRFGVRDQCLSWTFWCAWWMLELDVLVCVMNAWVGRFGVRDECLSWTFWCAWWMLRAEFLYVHILQTNCWRFRHGQCQVGWRVTLLRMTVWIRPHVANGVHQNLCSALLCPTNVINWSDCSCAIYFWNA